MKSYLVALNGYVDKEPFNHDFNRAKHIYRRQHLLEEKDDRLYFIENKVDLIAKKMGRKPVLEDEYANFSFNEWKKIAI